MRHEFRETHGQHTWLPVALVAGHWYGAGVVTRHPSGKKFWGGRVETDQPTPPGSFHRTFTAAVSEAMAAAREGEFNAI